MSLRPSAAPDPASDEIAGAGGSDTASIADCCAALKASDSMVMACLNDWRTSARLISSTEASGLSPGTTSVAMPRSSRRERREVTRSIVYSTIFSK